MKFINEQLTNINNLFIFYKNKLNLYFQNNKFKIKILKLIFRFLFYIRRYLLIIYFFNFYMSLNIKEEFFKSSFNLNISDNALYFYTFILIIGFIYILLINIYNLYKTDNLTTFKFNSDFLFEITRSILVARRYAIIYYYRSGEDIEATIDLTYDYTKIKAVSRETYNQYNPENCDKITFHISNSDELELNSNVNVTELGENNQERNGRPSESSHSSRDSYIDSDLGS